MTGCIRRGNGSEPVALESELGWILSGSFSHHTSPIILVSTSCCQVATSNPIKPIKSLKPMDEGSLNVEVCLKKFWETDSLGLLMPDDDMYGQFKADLTFDGSKYTAKLPIKLNVDELANNMLLKRDFPS